jgi:flagellar export protein FliJ
MAFRYALQSVLRLRQSLERQEEQRLFVIAARVAKLRAQIEELEEARQSAWRAAWDEMSTGTCGAVVQFAAACDSAASDVQTQLQAQLVEEERLRLEQLSVYQSARQRREVLENLRERQEAVYERDAAHREQERADDTFLSRFRVRLSD